MSNDALLAHIRAEIEAAQQQIDWCSAHWTSAEIVRKRAYWRGQADAWERALALIVLPQVEGKS